MRLITFILLLTTTVSIGQQYSYEFDIEDGILDAGAFVLKVNPNKPAEINANSVKIYFQAANYLNVDWDVYEKGRSSNSSFAYKIPRRTTKLLEVVENLRYSYHSIWGKTDYTPLEFSITFYDNIENPVLGCLSESEASMKEIFWIPIFQVVIDIFAEKVIENYVITDQMRMAFAEKMYERLKNIIPESITETGIKQVFELLKSIGASEVSEILKSTIEETPQVYQIDINVLEEVINLVIESGFDALCTSVSGSQKLCTIAKKGGDLLLEIGTRAYDLEGIGGLYIEAPLKRTLICTTVEHNENQITITGDNNNLILSEGKEYEILGNFHTGKDKDLYLFKINQEQIGGFDIELNTSDATTNLGYYMVDYFKNEETGEFEVYNHQHRRDIVSGRSTYRISKEITNFNPIGTSGEVLKRFYALSLSREQTNECSPSNYLLKVKYTPYSIPQIYQRVGISLSRSNIIDCSELQIGNYRIEKIENTNLYNLNLNIIGTSDANSFIAKVLTENEILQSIETPFHPLPYWDNSYNVVFKNLNCNETIKLEINEVLSGRECIFYEYFNLNKSCSSSSCSLINVISQTPTDRKKYPLGQDYTLSWSISNISSSCLYEYELELSNTSDFSGTTNTFRQTSNSKVFSMGAAIKLYWRVKARNTDGNWGNWTTTRYIEGYDPNSPSAQCDRPTGLYVNSITNNEATVAWRNVEPDETYQVQWGIGNYNNSITAGSNDYKNLINLQSDQTYQWRVRTTCANGDNSNWSIGNTFTTLRSDQINAQGDLRVSGTPNVSDDDGLCKGDIITIDYEAYYTGTSSENVEVQFGVFLSDDTNYDANDIFLAETFSSFGVSGSIGGGSDSEDFSFDIQLPFDIEQPAENNFDKYLLVVADYNNRFIETNEGNNVRYRDLAFSCRKCCVPNSHNYDAGSTAYLDVGGIPFCERYLCETCDDGVQNGDETDIDCGGVLCAPCGSDCNAYEIVAENQITSNRATLQWSEGATANSYTVFYKKSTESTYQEIYTSSTTITLYGLTPNTQYCWYVRTNCNDELVQSSERCFTTEQGIFGCTSPLAHNYNSNATDDDGSCETCTDGVQNGDETAIDCGGNLCEPCNTNNCAENWTIVDAQTNTPLFSAIHYISTSGIVTVESNEAVTFDADYIDLNDGFDTQSGAFFEAKVNPCDLGNNVVAVNAETRSSILHENNNTQFLNREKILCNQSLSIYPNPFKSQTNITFQVQDISPINIQLFDITGQKISTVFSSNQTIQGQHTISLERLNIPTGVYICTMQTKDCTVSKQIIIQ